MPRAKKISAENISNATIPNHIRRNDLSFKKITLYLWWNIHYSNYVLRQKSWPKYYWTDWAENSQQARLSSFKPDKHDQNQINNYIPEEEVIVKKQNEYDDRWFLLRMLRKLFALSYLQEDRPIKIRDK